MGVRNSTTAGRSRTVATFNGPMPTGVAVSKTNRVFVNFPRWGDPVEFTVAATIAEYGRESSSPISPKNSLGP